MFPRQKAPPSPGTDDDADAVGFVRPKHAERRLGDVAQHDGAPAANSDIKRDLRADAAQTRLSSLGPQRDDFVAGNHLYTCIELSSLMNIMTLRNTHTVDFPALLKLFDFLGSVA